MRRLMILLLLVPGLFGAAPSVAQLPAVVDGEPLPSLAPMLERTIPGVVNIATRARVVESANLPSPLFDDPFFRRFFDRPERSRERERRGLGSGVIVDASAGTILTNSHVVARADTILVTLHDGRQYEADVVGTDPATDVAVIRIDAEDLEAIPLADSDELRVGDFVVAIGNPYGLGQTVTSGIVSALGRSGLGGDGIEDFIQTDASINPGNSGGALVNLRGELVGINTAILARGGGNVGIGFAIPANMASQIQEHLLVEGRVERGALGVEMQDLTPALARAFGLDASRGAVITRVTRTSAAERAGLAPGDIVLELNDQSVRSAVDLHNRLGLLRAGSRVRLTVLRDGATQEVVVRLDRPEAHRVEGAAVHPRLEGVRLAETSGPEGRSGVVVIDVETGSIGERAGLRPGDVLLAINRQRIQHLSDLPRKLAADQVLALQLRRGNQSVYLTLR
ncbi:Do family serine endopeptidase [Thioalkalivibrio sp. ALJT]|uniref:Do family serine endopeptidase n=1 Tax=Thioalkalivibrio sp. ALJT TaxID=1158146 RepID=UPI000376F596|nr:Do family serine endopeptidase [Thioalkalivibrio sp. ALJT]